MNQPITVVKRIDIESNGDKIALTDVERLHKRYSSAGGQRDSVINEVFRLLTDMAHRQGRLECRFDDFEKLK